MVCASPVPELYAPYTLKTFWADMRWNMRLLVRSTNDDIAAAVRREGQDSGSEVNRFMPCKR